MTQRTVLVTGASGGIGAATVRLLREQGWQVIGVDRGGQPESGAHRHLTADLADEVAITQLVGQLDALDALVNNAAISGEDWDAVMAVNVRAAFVATRDARPLLKASHGAVVNVSSVHALATASGVAAYAASKGALLALTRATALDLAADGIRVNAVIPGAIDTPMLRHGSDDDQRIREIEARTPLGRIGKPAEVAQAIAFLLDNQRAAFITGAALTVDGGALARLSTE
jgi:NAD(P)-dependent dehydrogenase (short-subunit alcohol dehydrogenase family)